MGKTLGCIAIIVLVVIVAGVYVMNLYNGLVEAEQKVEAQWAQVENVYQRRADLVPNLVATVRGAAEFEQETLTRVVEARSRVGQISAEATSDIVNNPQKLRAFQQAQDELSSALSRLLVVVERYPQLRAVGTFRDLMTQLEGTENRIAVERRRFNIAARDFNVLVKRFPANLIASMLGFEEKAYFESAPGAEQAPDVDFDFGGEAAEPATQTP